MDDSTSHRRAGVQTPGWGAHGPQGSCGTRAKRGAACGGAHRAGPGVTQVPRPRLSWPRHPPASQLCTRAGVHTLCARGPPGAPLGTPGPRVIWNLPQPGLLPSLSPRQHPAVTPCGHCPVAYPPPPRLATPRPRGGLWHPHGLRPDTSPCTQAGGSPAPRCPDCWHPREGPPSSPPP